MLALDEDITLEGLADPDVLAMAATTNRILVTFNVRDFAPLLQEWAGKARNHSGCILVVGLDHRQIGEIVRRLSALLGGEEVWTNRVRFLSGYVSAVRALTLGGVLCPKANANGSHGGGVEDQVHSYPGRSKQLDQAEAERGSRDRIN